MKDNLYRAISADGGVVIYALDSTDIVAQMQQFHHCSATVAAALGRLLSAAALMSCQLKNETDTLTVRVNGGGSCGTLIAVSDAHGNVRGCSGEPRADLPTNSATGKLDVGGVVGKNGQLTVIRDVGLKEPYVGSVSLVSGEIAEDITKYYAVSEQTPTVCSLGVLVDKDLSIKCAGGFLLQLLPGADDAEISRIEKNIASLESVTAMLDSGMSVPQMIEMVMAGFDPQTLGSSRADYVCNCSQQRMARALLSIPRADYCQLIEEDKGAEIVCNFCGHRYYFSGEKLKEMRP